MNWLRKNWHFLVIGLLIYFLVKASGSNNYPTFDSQGPSLKGLSSGSMFSDFSVGSLNQSSESYSPEIAPSDSTQRLVSRNSSLSLLVKDVPTAIREIQSQAQSLGGFLVNSSLSRPDSNASGDISVRVPSEKLDEAMDQIKSLGLKTVYESVVGRDLTDQYEDIQTRLDLLESIKTKYQSILSSATRVQDILEVQREIINTQSQIDSLKGQQLYLEKSASLSLISVSLSTDELSLPYTPDQTWRPQVIFKQSVRSLISSFRTIGNFAIKAFVFTPIWLPLLLVFIFYKRRKSKL
jgi:hypothetical protein